MLHTILPTLRLCLEWEISERSLEDPIRKQISLNLNQRSMISSTDRSRTVHILIEVISILLSITEKQSLLSTALILINIQRPDDLFAISCMAFSIAATRASSRRAPPSAYQPCPSPHQQPLASRTGWETPCCWVFLQPAASQLPAA